MNYAPFEGDGRVNHPPTVHIPGTQPMSVTRAQARNSIRRFVETGQSSHSDQGGTLWVIIAWCHHHHREYRLDATPGEWYVIQHTDTRPIP